METTARVRQIARDVLGYPELRPGQLEAAAALADGRDCLAILPSGAGKSAIYQIAAVALGGPAVVVSPLLALQREQTDALRARGLTAVAVNALSGATARREAEALLAGGGTGFIFLGPEQLARDDVRDHLARAPVRLFAVDEAHCIASWGHDFRPDYLRLGGVIEAFPARPAVAALTATAAPPVRQEIVARLGLRDPRQVIRDFDRPEIHLAVRSFHRADDQRAAVLAAVREQAGSAWYTPRPGARPRPTPHCSVSVITTAAWPGPTGWPPSGSSKVAPPSSPPARSAWAWTGPTCASSCTPRYPARWMSTTRRSAAAAVMAARPPPSAATGPRTWAWSASSPPGCPIRTTWPPSPPRWTAR